MNLAVIPARGGSKRIPRKNIKDFCGKPIIAWSIEAALASQCFDRVIVSTDDEEIASIAMQYGAEVPFIRPSEISNEYTATTPVIQHAINWFSENVRKPELVCCLYATAPFVSADDIVSGLEDMVHTDSSFAFTVTNYVFPIQRAIKIGQNKQIEMFSPEHFMTRSQDLEEAYHDAGKFYWRKSSASLDNELIIAPRSIPILLPPYRVQDIDTQQDWDRAELLFKVMNK